MYHATGFSKDDIITLCAMIVEEFGPHQAAVGRNRCLGLFKSVVVTLTHLRRNRVHEELAEQYETSQATISRTVARYTPILGERLKDWVPTVEDLDPAAQLIVDGTLLPCWSWADHPNCGPASTAPPASPSTSPAPWAANSPGYRIPPHPGQDPRLCGPAGRWPAEL